MRRLIRFEDAYGMADIVCIAHKLGLVDFSVQGNGIVGIKQIHETDIPGVFIECGLSFPDIFMVDGLLVSNLKSYGIEEVIVVYDMDSLNGKGIISSNDLQVYLTRFTNELKRQGINICIKLAPVVWAAETLALCIMGCDGEAEGNFANDIDASEIVHSLNTAKLHGKIINLLLSAKYPKQYKKAKHLREYITDYAIKDCLTRLLKSFPESINFKVVDWIIREDFKVLFDIPSAIIHQQRIEEYYKKHLPNSDQKFIVCEQSLDLNKKCW